MNFNATQSRILAQKIYHAVSYQNHDDLDALFNMLSYQNYSPVTRVENELGIKGLYQHYAFPDALAPLEFESLAKPMRIFEIIEKNNYPAKPDTIRELNQIKPKYLEAVKEMYTALVKLNPELKQADIDPDKISTYINIISGACSGFPAEDIIEFSRIKTKEENIKLNKKRLKNEQEIINLTGAEPNILNNWCPSEKTFNKIITKIKSNPYSPPLSRGGREGSDI